MAAADSLRLTFIAASGLGAVAASLFAAPGSSGITGAGLGLLMLAIAIIDWHHFTIPDELSALALLLGIAAAALGQWPDAAPAMLDAATRGAAMTAIFLAFRLAYRRLRRREGLGLGDVKLAGVAGVWLEWTSLPLAVDIAAVSALGFVVLRSVRSRAAPDPLARLPLGSFLAPAIWLSWLIERWWA